jgi:hypothetical protein
MEFHLLHTLLGIIWKSVTCHGGRITKQNMSYPVNLGLSFRNARNSSPHKKDLLYVSIDW